MPRSPKSHFRLSESNIIYHLRSLSTELISLPRDNLTKERRVNLGKRFLASDRELLAQMHNNSSISSIVATAALLYSQAVLRGMNCTSRVIGTLAGQLKESITSALTSEDDVFAEDPAALAWVLLVGALACGKERSDGAWFMWCLKRACETENELFWAEVQKGTDIPSHLPPQPFYWIFNEDILYISAVNTRFHLG